MSIISQKVVTYLLDDTKFINKIKLQIDKIMEDGKLDISDLVPIVTLIIEIVKNKDIFLEVNKTDIAEVFRCLILSIFQQLEIYKKLKNKSGLDDEIIQNKVDLIIENLLTILVSKVKTMSFFKKICKKCKCCKL